MRYFIDTNIFLRTLIKENKKTFDECFKLLSEIKIGNLKASTSHVVLAELVWTLSSYYGFSKEKVVTAVKSVVNLRGLQFIDGYQAHMSLELYEKKPVKFIDALIASIKTIREKTWVVVSYDKDFDKMGISRKEPGELVTTSN